MNKIKTDNVIMDLTLLLILFLLMMIPGCGSKATDDKQISASDPNETIYYGETGLFRGFDPAQASDTTTANAVARMYEGLVQYSYLDRPYKVERCLAEGLPEISADGLTYTFKIRKGIFFQDDPCFTNTPAELGGPGKGRELVAEDFVFSIKRIADNKVQSTGFWVYDGKIVGLDEFHEASIKPDPTDYSMLVEGLQSLDRYTLQIKLKKAYPQLIWILTMPYAFAVPREAVEYYKDDFVNHPVGTGPYILSYFKYNYRIEYVKNPKWAETRRIELYPSTGAPGDMEKGLLEDAGKQMPFIDKIILYVLADPSTQWLKFVTGEMEASGISRANWNAVITQEKGLTEALERMKVSLFTEPSMDIAYIGFNMEDPVVGGNPDSNIGPEKIAKNRKLRQALACAFNYKKYEQFQNYRVVPAKGPVPPSIPGCLDDSEYPYSLNLDKAKKLLEEAGYPGGTNLVTGEKLKLTIEVGNASDPDTRQSLEILADNFKEIGVILEPSYNNWNAFLKKMERKQSQMFRLGWVADYPDAQNFLQLFYTPSSPESNHSNYSNKKFDELYQRASIMQDTPERTALYKQMSTMVVEDCPWIFLSHNMSYGLYHCWLKNVKPHDFPYGMEKYRNIDKVKRDKWRKDIGSKNWKTGK